MDKLWLIAQREFLFRVRQKSFLLTTFLVPLFFVGIMAIGTLSGLMSDGESYAIQVLDPSGKIAPRLSNDENLAYTAVTGDVETLKQAVLKQPKTLLMVLPADLGKADVEAEIFGSSSPNLTVKSKIRRALSDAIRNARLSDAGLTPETIEKLKVDVTITTRKITADGKAENKSAELAYVTGLVMAFLTYFMMLMYGNLVMQAVMEEKTNRIMEVVISSVKPVYLMLGKLIGIGMVGLTQILLWLVLMTGIGTGLGAFMASRAEKLAAMGGDQAAKAAEAARYAEVIGSFDFTLVIYFIIFFLGGFLIYGSLYAAIGSAVDQPQDAQQLATVAIVPIIMAMMLANVVISNPNSPLALWTSMFPLFSPTLMMVRLASGEVPFYQVLLSIALLAGGVVGMAWLAGRIYRVGVLMYGKKVSIKEFFRWAFVKV